MPAISKHSGRSFDKSKERPLCLLTEVGKSENMNTSSIR